MKIFFTQPAKEKLKEIYFYYKQAASTRVAKSVKNRILSDIKKLRKTPGIGNEEDALKFLERNYRKLISGNYKIIYRIIEKQIIIDTIFDSRQEPEKIKNI